jgi:hypothetical protein
VLSSPLQICLPAEKIYSGLLFTWVVRSLTDPVKDAYVYAAVYGMRKMIYFKVKS